MRKHGYSQVPVLDQGRLVPATDYINAQRLRRQLRRHFDTLWQQVDCLITPATPASALRSNALPSLSME